MARLVPEEARSLESARRPASAPPGFELIAPVVGVGKTSIVAKLRRLSDGAVFAWKLPLSDDADVAEAMQAQTRRSVEWRRVGISRVVSVWAPDGRTLLQPWVEGASLHAVLASSSALTDPADPRHAALIGLLRRLVTSRTTVSGLNANNLVYDGSQWQVVDSGRVREYATPSEAWERQRADLRRKWTRRDLAGRRRDVDAFLAAVDAALALPPAPFSVRRLWRRMRGR